MNTERRRTKFIWWTTVAAMLCLNLVLGLILMAHFLAVEPYDPFGEFPIQATPEVVVVGESVPVTAVKCYTEPVQTRGIVTWRSLEPKRASFFQFEGISEVREGCYELDYLNQWPPAAETQARIWLAEGERVVFTIEGSETPVRGGVTQPWQTTAFEVVSEGTR